MKTEATQFSDSELNSECENTRYPLLKTDFRRKETWSVFVVGVVVIVVVFTPATQYTLITQLKNNHVEGGVFPLKHPNCAVIDNLPHILLGKYKFQADTSCKLNSENVSTLTCRSVVNPTVPLHRRPVLSHRRLTRDTTPSPPRRDDSNPSRTHAVTSRAVTVCDRS